jgi:hypothetical protein
MRHLAFLVFVSVCGISASIAEGADATPSQIGAQAFAIFESERGTQAILQRYFLPRGGTVGLNEESYAVYAAAALNDPHSFALAVNPWIELELDQLPGEYQVEQFLKRMRSNPHVLRRLSEVRERLASMTFVAPVDGSTLDYERGQFRLILHVQADPIRTEEERLWAGNIGPVAADGAVSVARWKRFQCGEKRYSFGERDWRCYVALADVPSALMDRLESDLGRNLHARWRWKGLAHRARTASKIQRASLFPDAYTVPEGVHLEVVDQHGKVLYTLE